MIMLQTQSYELASSIVTCVTNCDVLLVVIKQRRDDVPRIENYYQQIIPMYSLDDCGALQLVIFAQFSSDPLSSVIWIINNQEIIARIIHVHVVKCALCN